MTARCPNNPEHKRFITVAHVMEEWLVDEHGNFCEVRAQLQTSHEPDPENIWTCATCGAKAEVSNG